MHAAQRYKERAKYREGTIEEYIKGGKVLLDTKEERYIKRDNILAICAKEEDHFYIKTLLDDRMIIKTS